MNSNRYDIIIPVGPKDIGFIPRVVDFVGRCLSGFDVVYIIVNKKYHDRLRRSLKRFEYCRLIDENDLIPNLYYNRVRELICKHASPYERMAGWYFQQFLKLGFSRSQYRKDFYLSWDADTLPLAHIDFFDDSCVLYNPKNESHANYFETMTRILGFGKLVEESFISESMMFSSKIMNEMLDQIEGFTDCGEDWIERIITACDFSRSPQAFSEFETYGNFCAKFYPNLYKSRHLNSFREAGLIRGRSISEDLLRKMSFDLDMASFEISDMPCFPYNIPNLLFKFKGFCERLRSLSFRKIVSIITRKVKGGKNIQSESIYRLPLRTMDRIV